MGWFSHVFPIFHKSLLRKFVYSRDVEHFVIPLKLKTPRSMLLSASRSIAGDGRVAGSSLSSEWAMMPAKILGCQSLS